MKKKIKSTLALMLALTMVIGSSMTVFAATDGCYRPENPNRDTSGFHVGPDTSSDSGSSGGGSNSGSGSGSGSSSESSGGGGSYSSESGSYDAGSGSSGSTGSYSAPAPRVTGKEASAGKESFKALAKPAAGTYKVTHKGTEVATFRLMDAEKRSVACTKVSLKQRDDKKWAIDFEVADAKGLTIGAPVDRTYMYDTLGVSYVTINDEVVIDIEAEAAAAKAAK